MKRLINFLFFALILASCSEETFKYNQDNLIVGVEGQWAKSTTAGNLVTSAIRNTHNLDIVLYPTSFLEKSKLGVFSQNIKNDDLNSIVEVYPKGAKDEFVIGNMNGRDLKNFIFQRSLERFALELEVAGIHYDIMFKGGVLVSQSFQTDRGHEINDDQNYLIAISKHFIFSGDTFPSYKYRNSIDRIFHHTNTIVSARKSVLMYLQSTEAKPLLNLMRARVKQSKAIDRGVMRISSIQGISHLSPIYGDKVTTTGIVTAIAQLDSYPGGFEAYIQDPTQDGDDRTSEAIKLYFEKKPLAKKGDLIELTGIVHEETNHIQHGLTATSLRNISNLKILKSNAKLPEPILLGTKGRALPQHHLSTFIGNLNFKPSLKLTDGIDFWESVEGMRVTISNPKIVGFRGGRESIDETKRHLTLYMLPESNAGKLTSDSNGILADTDHHDFNPDIIPIVSGIFTKGLGINDYYRVGDKISGDVTGLISFNKNLFGDAEYNMFLTENQKAMSDFSESIKDREMLMVNERGITQLPKSEDNLSIAAYNVKNLSQATETSESSFTRQRTVGAEIITLKEHEVRLDETAKMIKTNMNCPDILGLVEIQDDNGEEFSGNAQAKSTLEVLIDKIPCEGFKYKAVNIDPLNHREGGVPGGNIRVALIYNPTRVGFTPKPLPGPMVETLITVQGNLNYNPGRIRPNDAGFRNSRKSIIAQFDFKGEPVFVVVNHFNSKLSDTSHFSAMQPSNRGSEIRRSLMARAVNSFVGNIERLNPKANIAVVGDFNAYLNEGPMKVLEGNELYNLMRDLPLNDRYTTNHNGNSQSLDYIFVNKNLRSKKTGFEVLQINSDYMRRLSDHDPIMSTFSF